MIACFDKSGATTEGASSESGFKHVIYSNTGISANEMALHGVMASWQATEFLVGIPNVMVIVI